MTSYGPPERDREAEQPPGKINLVLGWRLGVESVGVCKKMLSVYIYPTSAHRYCSEEQTDGPGPGPTAPVFCLNFAILSFR